MNNIKNLFLSYFLMSFGNSFTTFIFPFLIYETTESAFYTAFLVTVMALGSFTACYAVNNNNFFKSDKSYCLVIEIISSFLIIIPVFLEGDYFIYSIFLISFLASFLGSAKSGYNESLIGNIVEASYDNRARVIGKIKVGASFGALLGFIFAPIVIIYLGNNSAFLIDSLFLLLSAFFINKIKEDSLKENRKKKPVFSILFSKDRAFFTISHLFSAFSLFIYNGTFIFILKDTYDVSDFQLSMYFIVQMILSIIGGFCLIFISKKVSFSLYHGIFIRMLYSISFLLISFSSSFTFFLIFTSILNMVHSFSMPIWQSIFQELSTRKEWAIIGASRKSLVNAVGVLGSAFGGWSIFYLGLMTTYMLGFFLCLLSSLFVYLQYKAGCSLYSVKEEVL